MLVWYAAAFIVVLYLGNVLGVKMLAFKIKELRSVRGLVCFIPIYVTFFPFLILFDESIYGKDKIKMLIGYFLYPNKNILFARILARDCKERFERRDKSPSIRDPEFKKQINELIGAYVFA
jgi:hypothetical protein